MDVESRSQMPRRLTARLLEAARVDDLQFARLQELLLADANVRAHAPAGIGQIDPRDGAITLFNPGRARRPHDNPAPPPVPVDDGVCPICRGETTGIVDLADLSQGFTFINKNLFPILYPSSEQPTSDFRPQSGKSPQWEGGVTLAGMHFLQWSSSYHHRDWHNMPLADRVVLVERLAALERVLLSADSHSGYVTIVKNYGSLVGGSLYHGHQQIVYSQVQPGRLARNQAFAAQHGQPFTAYLLRENPPALTVRDYGPAVLLTPYFMKRPYEMFLVMRDTSRRFLHQLSAEEITAVAQGWRDAIRAILDLMPRIGRPPAYLVLTHNGLGAGLYFEFLPYTQEIGSAEHLGFWVCQGTPEEATTQLRRALEQR